MLLVEVLLFLMSGSCDGEVGLYELFVLLDEFVLLVFWFVVGFFIFILL